MVRIAFAGDREIGVKVLKFILDQGVHPLALLIPKNATHGKEILSLCPHLDRDKILIGKEFLSSSGIERLKKLDLDYIISIHFPYIYPKEVIDTPKHGIVNLHPAYLPFNRGWHTPTWAIWDETPYGATLHFVNESVDGGDIIHQKKIEIYPHDTADTLYKRVLELEFEVFKEAWPDLANFRYRRKPQPKTGTFHRKDDIEKIQFIDLDQKIKAYDLIKRLRALTTNKVNEAAYFMYDGKKYRIQVRIIPEEETNCF